MIRKLLAAAILAATPAISHAQFTPQNSPIKITGITPSFEKSPDFSVGIGPQRKATSQDWLWIEVSFVYENPKPDAPPIDDLALNYYVLLNNASKPANPLGTLLTGTITHTGVTSGKDVRHSVALISPQTLRRFFGGRAPSNAGTAVQAIGVTATVAGQLAAEVSIDKGKGRPQWWQAFQQGPAGLVLGKSQTPFAPLFYDYFEAEKAKGGAL